MNLLPLTPDVLVSFLTILEVPILLGVCSSFISVATTKCHFTEEKMYLIDTARSLMKRGQGRISKGDLKAKPMEGVDQLAHSQAHA